MQWNDLCNTFKNSEPATMKGTQFKIGETEEKERAFTDQWDGQGKFLRRTEVFIFLNSFFSVYLFLPSCSFYPPPFYYRVSFQVLKNVCVPTKVQMLNP